MRVPSMYSSTSTRWRVSSLTTSGTTTPGTPTKLRRSVAACRASSRKSSSAEIRRLNSLTIAVIARE